MNFTEICNSNPIFVDYIDKTPLGSIWVALSSNGLVAVEIGGNRDKFIRGLRNRIKKDCLLQQQTVAVKDQIQEYLNGERNRFDISIDWSVMTKFQQKTLTAVREIPFGETRTYGQIAAQLGNLQAARAVGRANATNPIPLVIPCHRLVGADGSLRGYGGGEGIKTKRWLLDLERRGTQSSDQI
jgi:methylated-DNA-[protein]-cysteine S-methyltransferase